MVDLRAQPAGFARRARGDVHFFARAKKRTKETRRCARSVESVALAAILANGSYGRGARGVHEVFELEMEHEFHLFCFPIIECVQPVAAALRIAPIRRASNAGYGGCRATPLFSFPAFFSWEKRKRTVFAIRSEETVPAMTTSHNILRGRARRAGVFISLPVQRNEPKKHAAARGA